MNTNKTVFLELSIKKLIGVVCQSDSELTNIEKSTHKMIVDEYFKKDLFEIGDSIISTKTLQIIDNSDEEEYELSHDSLQLNWKLGKEI